MKKIRAHEAPAQDLAALVGEFLFGERFYAMDRGGVRFYAVGRGGPRWAAVGRGGPRWAAVGRGGPRWASAQFGDRPTFRRLAYRTPPGAQPHRQLPSPAAALEPRAVAASLEA
eukprot:scaffold86921_cov46-Phaeocystis_antarctica.AAC.1